ncbi:MAG: CARDB domain-containing protein, partial [Pirellulales bacterium]
EYNAGGTAENNNTDTIPFTSTIAAYPDLQVTGLAVDPSSVLESGGTVTINWNDANTGDGDTSGSWHDRIRVVSTTTSQTLLDTTLFYNSASLGNIAAGDSQARQYSFTLPQGSPGVGDWQITITTDYFTSLFEYNAGGTAENNNTDTIPFTSTIAAYPDLQVTGLAVDPSSVLESGGTVTINWNDANTGDGATSGSWYDRIVVVNTTTSQALVDTALHYNPASPGHGNIAAGDVRARQHSFTLPQGTSGVGDWQITITTDVYNYLFEHNAGGTAETNNAATPVNFTSVLAPYPDLSVHSVLVPNDGIAGQKIEVAWTISNLGTAAIASGWTDQVYLSIDDQFQLSQDIYLGAFSFSGTLAVDEDLTRIQDVTIPSGTSGTYRVIVTSQLLFGSYELNTLNNVDVSTQSVDIQLPLRPNLIVSSITPPSGGFSGQASEVSFTVTNIGHAATSTPYWYDRVYLSSDPIPNLGDTPLGQIANASYLDFGNEFDSYTSTLSFTWPENISGTYYLIVSADNLGNSVEEENDQDNATASAPINITLTPPPDLTVLDVQVPTSTQIGDVQVPITYHGGDAIYPSWTVQNISTTPTNVGSWLDGVYLSHDTVLDASDVPLVGIPHTGALAPNGGYTTLTLTYREPGVGLVHAAGAVATPQVDGLFGDGNLIPVPLYNIRLPLTLAPGDYYVLVRTDANSAVNEHGLTGNNVGWSDEPIHVELPPLPDLSVSPVTIPASAAVGQPLTIQYSVTNAGQATTSATSWYDQVYLSGGPNFNPSTDYYLGTVNRSSSLVPGASYNVSQSFALPTSLPIGNYRVVVVADAGQQVYELNRTNNLGVSGSVGELGSTVTVVSQPADLVVSATNLDRSSAVVGSSLRVDWTVTNHGAGPTNASTWYDAVYLSSDDVFGTDVQIGTFLRSGVLAAGASYSATRFVTVPFSLPGPYHVFVVTDVVNGVFEGALDGNNSSLPQAVNIDAPAASISVDSVSLGQSQIVGGQSLSVSWTVGNYGAATFANAWIDRVYLSADSILDGSDIPLGNVPHSGVLAAFPGGSSSAPSYNATRNFIVPTNISGPFRVIVRADFDNQVFEGTDPTAKNDNSRASTATVDVTMPVIHVPVYNLVATSVSAPAEATSGQLVTVTWSVENRGDDDIVGKSWYDAVYLSRDRVLDRSSDLYLGTVSRSASLAAGDTYSVTHSFSLPAGVSGQFYAIVAADSGQSIPQTGSLRDKVIIATDATQLILPLPVDLVLGTILVPVNGAPGQSTNLTYTVSNIGGYTAKGSWFDSLYLSTDDHWDVGDAYVGQHQHSGDVAPGGSYTATLTAPLPAVTPGRYYVIARSDIRNQIPESSESNNVGASLDDFSLDVPELLFNQAATGYLTQSQAVYYRLDVPAGETVRLRFDSESPTGFTELYARYGKLPTRSQFDYSYSQPYAADQEIVLSGTRAGTYYILAYGNDVDLIQEFGGIGPLTSRLPLYSLTADSLDFSVLSVGPNHGSNRGSVTVTIAGAGFSPSDQASLVAGNGSNRPATKQWWVSDTELWATFDLTGLPTGAYSVELAHGALQTVLPGAFTVNDRAVGRLDAKVNATGLILPGVQGTVVVEYANSGETDIEAPFLTLTANNAQLRTPDQTTYTTSQLQFLGTSTKGPAGILPPGAVGTFQALFAAPPGVLSGNADFVISVSQFDATPIDWQSIADGSRPDSIEADAWSAIWSNFEATVGTTFVDYSHTISESASYLSQLGIRTNDVGRLENFLFAQAVAYFPIDVLTDASDLSLPGIGMNLEFHRWFRNSLISRYELGPLGRGWTHNWDYSLSADNVGNILVHTPLWDREFLLQADGTYAAGSPADHGRLVLVDGRLQLIERDSTRYAFGLDGLLDFVADPRGNRITAGYTQGRLTSLTHSSGAAFTLSYDLSGRLAGILDSAGRNVTFQYDPSSEHLTAVTNPAGTTQYAYDASGVVARRHTLSSIAYPGGTHAYFTYDDRGRLVAAEGDGGAERVDLAYGDGAEIGVMDAMGAQYVVAFTDQGQAARIVDPLGKALRLAYDESGNLLRFSTPQGTNYTFVWDSEGNLLSRQDPLGTSIGFTYDANNQLTSTRDELDNITTYTYDTLQQLTAITDPSDLSRTFGYDGLGNPIRITNRRNAATVLGWNATGRVTSAAMPDGATEQYGYDAIGNLVSVTDTSGTTTFTYDAASRLTSVTYPNGRFLEYTYDGGGRRTSITDQNGFRTNYSYDAAGRLWRLTDATGNSVATYTYNAAGRLVRTDLGNGTYTTYEYDAAGQLLHLVNYAPDGSVNSSFDYTYDALGLRTTMGTVDGTWSYEYDATGQLTHAVFASTNPAISSQDLTYVYDAAGNRVRTVINGATTDYATNSLNQYVTVGDTTYQYDADGNLVSKSDASGPTTYTYDELNRLVSVTDATDSWIYEYDALGNRVAAIHNGELTEELVDPTGLGSLMGTYDAQGSSIAAYSYGLGLVGGAANGETTYYHFDALGSASSLTGSGGHHSQATTYAPFGDTLASTGDVANQFKFVGQFGVQTDETGLLQMGSRFYDISLGRFMQEDPSGLGGSSVNLYPYTHNSPTNLIDPTGLSSFSDYVGGIFSTSPAEFYGGLIGGAIGEGVGTWVGAAEGVELGVAIGSLFGPPGIVAGGLIGALYGAQIGAVVGAFVGGVIGSEFGSSFFPNAGQIAKDPPPAFLQPPNATLFFPGLPNVPLGSATSTFDN